MTATVAPPAPVSGHRVGVRRGRTAAALLVLSVLLAATAVVAAGLGQLPVPPGEVLATIGRGVRRALLAVGLPPAVLVEPPPPAHPQAESTLWLIRFPRIVMALVVGAALAVGGALMQGVFRNPLAEPGIVGVSSGAAMGAAFAIVLEVDVLGPLTQTAAAFIGGLLATWVVYSAARSGGRTEVVTLVLTGIAVNAVAGAGIALATFLGSSQQREQIVFWQLGSLNGSRWQDVLVVLPIAVVGLIAAILLGRRLDLLALGERQAAHLGVRVERTRILVIVVVAVLTAAAVSLCGIIAFVGLVVPHLVRMLLGPAHRALVVVSAVAGAVLLLAADTVARTAVPSADLPIGMLTSLIGGPFFFWLLRRARRTSGGWA